MDCLPNKEWASFVYPDMDQDEAYEQLWETLLDISMVWKDTVPKQN